MPQHLLPSLLLYILVVGYTPGPANLYALSCSIKYGKSPALRMWYGQLTGFCIVALIICLFVHFIGTMLHDYIFWLKYVGAAYILWLAYNICQPTNRKKENTRMCSFVSGMIVQMTNAKIITFEIMIYSMFVLPYSNSLIDLIKTAGLLLLAGPGGNIVWLFAGVWMNKWFNRHQRKIDCILALLLALCAFMIIFN